MKTCSECGVGLDDSMSICPLCDTPTLDSGLTRSDVQKAKPGHEPKKEEKKQLMQQILWQITVVLLLSGVLATLTINLVIVGRITWSIYPISICLMILTYASLIALWRTRIIFQLTGGWMLSALLLLAINHFFHADWPLLLALPIVSAVNVVGIALYVVLVNLKTKGLNILALIFVALAVLGLVIECITSLFFDKSIKLGWSVIVAACLLPVTAAILFMYFKTRNNAELQKIFHT